MKQNVSPNNKVGDANQITREYFDSLLIEMRHIDSVIPSTKLELYGEMDSLSADGANGVQEKIEAMTEELSGAMARTCSSDIMHIDSSVIWKK